MNVLLRGPLLSHIPVTFCTDSEKLVLKCNSFGNRASFNCRCIKNEKTSASHEGFSVLTSDPQGDVVSIWSSMGFYVFSIHVPLSFGGLSAAAKILHQPVLHPHTELQRRFHYDDEDVFPSSGPLYASDRCSLVVAAQAFLILAIQILELSIVLMLLKCPGKPQYDLKDFFQDNKSSKQRSWLLASGLGFGVLLSLVFITSYVADRVMDPKDVNNPFLKEILSSGPSSVIVCILVYCIVTPLLEEVVYRGFLVTSLASRMNWQLAVTISSIVFSAAHFSGESFLQLLIVGFVLGCSYCWTGNLGASIAIHSLYNALILYSTYIS